MVSIFDPTLCYLHTKIYMCFSDFWYDSPRVPAYLWSRGKHFFFSPKSFCAISTNLPRPSPNKSGSFLLYWLSNSSQV